MQEELCKYYDENNYREDTRLSKDRAHNIEYLTTIRYFSKVLPEGSKILDACSGTGAYAFYLAEQGHKVTAGDLVEKNVDIIMNNQKCKPVLDSVYTGSILDLSRFQTESFDAVLNMGAFYHLMEEADRIRAVEESLRVLKKGGIYAAAYINRHANILKFRTDMKGNLDSFIEYSINGRFADDNIFYCSTPEELISFMEKFDLSMLHNIGTDGIGHLMSEILESFDEAEYGKWLQYHYATCEVKSLLGYSMHGLYIGRKGRGFLAGG